MDGTAQHIEVLLGMPAPCVRGLLPLPKQLSADGPEKAADDGPSAWLPAIHQNGIPGSCLSNK